MELLLVVIIINIVLCFESSSMYNGNGFYLQTWSSSRYTFCLYIFVSWSVNIAKDFRFLIIVIFHAITPSGRGTTCKPWELKGTLRRGRWGVTWFQGFTVLILSRPRITRSLSVFFAWIIRYSSGMKSIFLQCSERSYMSVSYMLISLAKQGH